MGKLLPRSATKKSGARRPNQVHPTAQSMNLDARSTAAIDLRFKKQLLRKSSYTLPQIGSTHNSHLLMQSRADLGCIPETCVVTLGPLKWHVPYGPELWMSSLLCMIRSNHCLV